MTLARKNGLSESDPGICPTSFVLAIIVTFLAWYGSNVMSCSPILPKTDAGFGFVLADKCK